MDGIGVQLRAARLRWQLTLRQVEDRSTTLSQEWQNPAYRISASWLDRVERNQGGLSASKLIVLAVIYGLTAEDLLGLCPPGNASLPALQQVSAWDKAGLLRPEASKLWTPEQLVNEIPPAETTLLPPADDAVPSPYRRGIIGSLDRTMEPMIPAGSLVLIDTRKRSIAGRKEWTHEFDRPIYFLMTHTGYVSGFCELDKAAQWLTLVPHALSREGNRRWRYKKEVEVIGTVTGIFLRRVA